jgi:hypothetical protein
MVKTSMGTRREIIEKHRARYRKSSKKEKGVILDVICTATGISRGRAKKLLAGVQAPVSKAKKRGRKIKYGPSAVNALEKIWAVMDFASGKRLIAGMNDTLDALIRFGEIGFDENTLRLLREMSPATADRLLKHTKENMRFKGISATKPGTLLKRDIPIRLGTEWDDAVPGYMECDLVAHCGMTAAGEYINTLDMTDICTGWTETRAVINKAQKHVHGAITEIKQILPFPLLGIDSDNGSEFINAHLYRYCKENGIHFTRSRPYMKNDNCHVEQKNWSVVRRSIGYARYEGMETVRVMNEYYALLRLHMNFFMPSVKLISKHRNGATVHKRYDAPQTPYKRMLESPCIEQSAKVRLTEAYLSLNPAALKRDMLKLLGELASMRVLG